MADEDEYFALPNMHVWNTSDSEDEEKKENAEEEEEEEGNHVQK